MASARRRRRRNTSAQTTQDHIVKCGLFERCFEVETYERHRVIHLLESPIAATPMADFRTQMKTRVELEAMVSSKVNEKLVELGIAERPQEPKGKKANGQGDAAEGLDQLFGEQSTTSNIGREHSDESQAPTTVTQGGEESGC